MQAYESDLVLDKNTDFIEMLYLVVDRCFEEKL
jgi:hypothetical protein